MTGGVFLIREDGSLVEFSEEDYPSEDQLQGYLADHPNLLAGDQIDSLAPRRWLLIRREVPLASDEGGAARWSADHVFLDQDAVPTFVEVKRSSDTRIRREVVGQMLEYASHAVTYWPAETMRAQFEARCASEGYEPAAVLAELRSADHGEEADDVVESFWHDAKANLEDGHLRLLFVADRIPPELRRIVEFLNEKMSDVEVLAVEIRQFANADMRTLVPRVYGQTEATRRQKSRVRDSRQWDTGAFFGTLQSRHPDCVAATKAIYDWANERGLRIDWGSGAQTGCMTPRLVRGEVEHVVVGFYTTGRIEHRFQSMKPPFDDADRRCEVVARFAAIPGFSFPEDAESKWPNVPLAALVDDSARTQFLAVLDWWVDEVEKS
jgi:hypothetical protein